MGHSAIRIASLPKIGVAMGVGRLALTRTLRTANSRAAIRTHVECGNGELPLSGFAARVRPETKTTADEGRSVEDVIRESVDSYAASHRKDRRAAAMAVAGRFRSGVADLGTRHDDYLTEDLK